MPNLLCPDCGRSFPRRRNLEQHISKNACKEYSHFCRWCNKGFTTQTSMYRHIRSSCKVKKENDEEKDKIYETLIEMKENYEKLAKSHEEIKKENKNLTKMIKSMQTGPVVRNNKNVNINTGTVNNNNTSNIILVGYGKEDLTKLDKTEIMKALQNGYYSTVKLTEAVHFNPKYPEYHNVYISNMKDKYAMMFDGKKWTLTMKEDLISQIYEDKKNYIEENLEDFIESLTLSRKRALERWLDTDDDDNKIREIKDSIKLLLYNSRQLPLKQIDCETSTKRQTVADIDEDNYGVDEPKEVVRQSIKRSTKQKSVEQDKPHANPKKDVMKVVKKKSS